MTRTPPTSRPRTNSARMQSPIVVPRVRWPINQYPAPGSSQPATATIGADGTGWGSDASAMARATL